MAVYCPVSYVCWNWELERFYYINDDAVGNLVHIVSGVSALVSAIILGPRKGFGNVMHSITGVCFLWVAWFGLNAVLATTSGNNVEMVLLATLIATAGASLSWMLVEWYLTGIPKLTAIGSGAIAGIIAITPASAHVLDCEGAFFLGLYAGPACFAGIQLKCYLGYDDELDVFAIHAIGGILGGFITGLVVADQVNRGYSGLNYMNTWDGGNQRLLQVYSMLFCFGWTGVVTFLILKTIDLTIGLRVNEDDEHAGLDSSQHGETLDGSLNGSRQNTRVAVKARVSDSSVEPEASAVLVDQP